MQNLWFRVLRLVNNITLDFGAALLIQNVPPKYKIYKNYFEIVYVQLLPAKL